MFPKANEVEGKQNSLFPAGPVIKSFVILSDSKKTKQKRYETNIMNLVIYVCLIMAGSQICCGVMGHDLIT